MTDKIKELAGKYLKGLAWLLIKQKTGNKEDIEKVILKLDLMEEDLKKLGVNSATIEELSKRAEKFVSTPISEMSRDQQLLICRLIYGQNTEWSKDQSNIQSK